MVKVADQAAELAYNNGLKVSPTIANSLLPTPTLGHIRNYDEPVEDYLERKAKGATGEYRGTPGISLGVAVRMEMLPTPVAVEGTKGMTSSPEHRKATGHQVGLSNYAPTLTHNWGRFEPAIRRWEQVIGRPAPAATKPDGKDGAHRLSEQFTEWLMGLPEGWVTGVGLSRNDALKACGNGVVPQQAELALRVLLENTQIEGINK
jgi:DNA (cytosine-5)-methyltransferase 1